MTSLNIKFAESFYQSLTKARKNTNTSPTENQIKSENYKKGTFTWKGLKIAIENPAGSTRSGQDDSGKKWSVTMKHDYGYIKGTKSQADGDAIDVIIGKDLDSEIVYVIDQYVKGKFDEHKCVIGSKSEQDARKVYLANYEKGWNGLKKITPLTLEQFKEWAFKGNSAKALSLQKLFKVAYGNLSFI